MIDKRMLIHEATIEKVTGRNEWGEEELSDPIFLAPVRFDRGVGKGRVLSAKNDDKLSHSGVLFVYPLYCPVMIDKSFLGANLTVNGESYKIAKIIEEYHPFKNTVFSYELEVV